MTDPQHPPSPAQEPSLPVVGHILRRKRDGFVRGLYPSPRTEEDYEYAKIDGDEYLALADHAAAIAALQAAQQRAEAAEAQVAEWREDVEAIREDNTMLARKVIDAEARADLAEGEAHAAIEAATRLQGTADEYDELIHHMNAGGDFHEFQAKKAREFATTSQEPTHG